MDKSAFRAAAALARSLKLKMHAVLVENQSLLRAASLPSARELVLPTYQWRPADPERLTRELRSEAEHVRLRIIEETRDFGIECGFEVRRGDPAAAVREQCDVQDIIAVIDSVDPIERLSGATGRMKQGALASEASVLHLPGHDAQPDGPIVAVVSDLRDEALAVATKIADVSGRALVVLMTKPQGHGTPLPSGATLLPLAEPSMGGILRTIGSLSSCFLVVSRSAIDLSVSGLDQLSTELGMPVLMTEPAVPRRRQGDAP
jgi:nucleotide-binding universal stress UspA family protein